jgi:hypothetical protein
MLLTGLLLGWGTKWRLTEWTWVLVKLSIGIVLTALVFLLLLPSALSIPHELEGGAAAVREALGGAARDLLVPPVVSFIDLGVALVLSIWKPWGSTRWARRRRGGRNGAVVSA